MFDTIFWSFNRALELVRSTLSSRPELGILQNSWGVNGAPSTALTAECYSDDGSNNSLEICTALMNALGSLVGSCLNDQPPNIYFMFQRVIGGFFCYLPGNGTITATLLQKTDTPRFDDVCPGTLPSILDEIYTQFNCATPPVPSPAPPGSGTSTIKIMSDGELIGIILGVIIGVAILALSPLMLARRCRGARGYAGRPGAAHALEVEGDRRAVRVLRMQQRRDMGAGAGAGRGALVVLRMQQRRDMGVDAEAGAGAGAGATAEGVEMTKITNEPSGMA